MRHILLPAYARPSPEPKMPPGLKDIMEGLTRDVLKHNPTNLYEFCADHMEKLLKIREAQTSKERRLTLKEKIRTAQDIVRERAMKHRMTSEKMSNGTAVSPEKLCDAKSNVDANYTIQNDEDVRPSKDNNSKENGLDLKTESYKMENHEIFVKNITIEDKNSEEVVLLSETKDESNSENEITQNSEKLNRDNVAITLDASINVGLGSDSNIVKPNNNFTVEEKYEKKDDHQLMQVSEISDVKLKPENDTLNNQDVLIMEHLQTLNSDNVKNGNQDKTVTSIIIPLKETDGKANNQFKIYSVSDSGCSQDSGAGDLQIKDVDISFENVEDTSDKCDINNEVDNILFEKIIDKANAINVEMKLENEIEGIDLPPSSSEKQNTKHVGEIIENFEDRIEIIHSPQNINNTKTEITNDFDTGNTFSTQSFTAGQDTKPESGTSIGDNGMSAPEEHDLNTTQNINSNSSNNEIVDDSDLQPQNFGQQNNAHAVQMNNNQNPQEVVNDFFANADIAGTEVNDLDNVIETEATSISVVINDDNEKTDIILDDQVSTGDLIQSNDLGIMIINNGSAKTPLLENVENKVGKPEDIKMSHDMDIDSTKDKVTSSQGETIDGTTADSTHIIRKRSTSVTEETRNENNGFMLNNEKMYEKATLNETVDSFTKNDHILNNKKLSAECTDDSVSSSSELDFNNGSQNNNNVPQIINAMDLETAAITIQKVFRSFLFRSRTSTLEDIHDSDSLDVTEYAPIDNNSSETENGQKINDDYLTRNIITERPRITRMDTILQTVNEEKSLSGSTDDSSLSSAATIIQAHARGFLARNKLNSCKNSSASSLMNSVDPPLASADTDVSESHKNKTILNIHILPEGGDFISKEESITASIDLPLEVSPPSSKLHPLGYDKSVRRKQLKREDAIQSVSPPSNNSGKLSEDEPIKGLVVNETEVSENFDKETVDGEVSDSCDTTPTNSATLETVIERTDNEKGLRKEDSSVEQRSRPALIKMSSDEMDVVTPFTPRDSKSETLLHSGEFHDVVVPTRVIRSDSSVVREFKNVLVYFLLWNN